MKRAFSAVATAIAVLSAAPAWAQSIGEFDCQKLLSATGFAQSNIGHDKILLDSFGVAFPTDDPISINERLASGNTPFLLTSLPGAEAGVQGISRLGCQLIVVEIYPGKETGNPLILLDGTGFRVPLLLARPFANIGSASERNRVWEDKNYNIQAVYSAAQLGTGPIALKSDKLLEPGFLELTSRSAEHSRVIDASLAPENVKAFLSRAGAGGARSILVLCGIVPCERLKNELIAPSEMPTEASPQPKQGFTFNRNPVQDADANAKSETPADLQDAVPASAPVNETIAFGFVVHVRKRDGSLTVEPIQGIGFTDCVLIALGADIFADTPACDQFSTAMEELRSLNALVEVQNNGTWHIVEGAQVQTPEQLSVTLPFGFDGSECQFDALYTTEDQLKGLLFLEIEPGSQGRLYSASVDRPMQIRNKTVSFEIVDVSGNSACAFEGQSVSLPATAELEVTLEIEKTATSGLAHVLLLHGEDLTGALGLDDGQATDLARKMIDAIHGAHSRVAQTMSDRNWSLVQASVGSVTARGKVVSLAELDLDDLRNRVGATFSAISPDIRERLASNQLALSVDQLTGALGPLHTAAGELGLDKLTFTLIGHVQRSDVTRISDPCQASLFQTVANNLNSRGGPRVELVLYSLHRMTAGDTLVTDKLQPMGVSAAALAEGGPYKCMGRSQDVTVYPFLIEPWRDGVDVSARYGAALSDQLALIIKDAATENGARP